jgi:hypothetical protein
MPKYIGNYVGFATGTDGTSNAMDGVFNLFDQVRIASTGNWPSAPLQASGGTTYTPGNGYKYHVFTHPNSDNFQVTSGSQSVEVLVVAGGGAAGNGDYSGGGGGGGIIYDTAFPVQTGTYSVTVGNGGQNPAGPESAGVEGEDSYFGPPSAPQGLTGKGGGGGGCHSGVAATPGGSGGGDGSSPGGYGNATQPSVTKPATATNYGYRGGGPAADGALSAAGGGGSGGIGGVNPGPSIGGLGGSGTAFPGFEYPLIGLSPLTPHSPSNNQYGGGGTGWGYDPGASQRGGFGGGGRGQTYPGSSPNAATAGVNNLGGGGGGGYPARGEPGGSGIVVVRYPN